MSDYSKSILKPASELRRGELVSLPGVGEVLRVTSRDEDMVDGVVKVKIGRDIIPDDADIERTLAASEMVYTTTEFRLCPFCGAEAEFWLVDMGWPEWGGHDQYVIGCTTCPGQANAPSYEEALAGWNRRSEPGAPGEDGLLSLHRAACRMNRPPSYLRRCMEEGFLKASATIQTSETTQYRFRPEDIDRLNERQPAFPQRSWNGFKVPEYNPEAYGPIRYEWLRSQIAAYAYDARAPADEAEKARIDAAIGLLNPRQLFVVNLRFRENYLKYVEIGRLIERSAVSIRKYEEKALRLLRHRLRPKRRNTGDG